MLNLCAILSILKRHSEAAIYAHDAISLLETEFKNIQQEMDELKIEEASQPAVSFLVQPGEFI